MAKGEAAIPIPVPVGGWRTDLPVNLVPADSLTDGSNVIVDRDGRMRRRKGYEPLTNQTGDPGTVKGGIAWSETASQQIVIASPTKWWLQQSTGWVDITDPLSPQSGDEPAVPARFAQFGFMDGQQVIYGVNGASQSPMRRWWLR